MQSHTMAESKYTNTAQQRVLCTLRWLVDAREAGALPSEIATALNTLPSNTTRDLANLRIAGFAAKVHERWYSASNGRRLTAGSKPASV